LVFVLFKNEYFGFVESSEIFVDKIINFIKSDIHTFPSKKTPVQLRHLGSTTFSTNQISVPLGTFFLKNQKTII
jgi:hypothetical protein